MFIRPLASIKPRIQTLVDFHILASIFTMFIDLIDVLTVIAPQPLTLTTTLNTKYKRVTLLINDNYDADCSIKNRNEHLKKKSHM